MKSPGGVLSYELSNEERRLLGSIVGERVSIYACRNNESSGVDHRYGVAFLVAAGNRRILFHPKACGSGLDEWNQGPVGVMEISEHDLQVYGFDQVPAYVDVDVNGIVEEVSVGGDDPNDPPVTVCIIVKLSVDSGVRISVFDSEAYAMSAHLISGRDLAPQDAFIYRKIGCA